MTDLNLNRPSFYRTNPRFGGVQKFLLSTGFAMSTESITVTINLKASEAYILRYISAILALADERCTDEGRLSILKGCKTTPEEMTRIHHKLFLATHEVLDQ